jgi:hypothetical protein
MGILSMISQKKAEFRKYQDSVRDKRILTKEAYLTEMRKENERIHIEKDLDNAIKSERIPSGFSLALNHGIKAIKDNKTRVEAKSKPQVIASNMAKAQNNNNKPIINNTFSLGSNNKEEHKGLDISLKRKVF